MRFMCDDFTNIRLRSVPIPAERRINETVDAYAKYVHIKSFTAFELLSIASYRLSVNLNVFHRCAVKEDFK